MKTMMKTHGGTLLLGAMAQPALANPVPSNVLFLTNVERLEQGIGLTNMLLPMPPELSGAGWRDDARMLAFHGEDYTNNLHYMLHRYQAPAGTKVKKVKVK